MANQASLFDLKAPCRPHVQPQVDGAAAVKPYASRQARTILSELRKRDMAMEEIVAATHLKLGSVCGRLDTLQHPKRRSPALLAPEALVVKLEEKRLSASDVLCYVYSITPAGREAVR